MLYAALGKRVQIYVDVRSFSKIYADLAKCVQN